MSIAKTPQPPYYAVIFTSLRREDEEGYLHTSERMLELVQQQEGFLGYESIRNGLGITISYWKDLESIKRWKLHEEHRAAQQKGKAVWYQAYKVRICKVEHDYGFVID